MTEFLIIAEKMNSEMNSKLHSRIAGIMSMYKRYPNKEDYHRVSMEITTKYPFLRSPISGYVRMVHV